MTINTDNRLVSSTDTVKELTIAVVRPVIKRGLLERLLRSVLPCSMQCTCTYTYTRVPVPVPFSNHLVSFSSRPRSNSRKHRRTPLINLLINLMTIKQESFELTPGELRRIVKCGFMRSFYPGSHGEKQAYVKSVMSYYDAVALRHGVAAPTGEFE